MGSSAALITSLVGALMHFLQVKVPEGEILDVIHNLAQICHCFVQRKVGASTDTSLFFAFYDQVMVP
jgi:phosphomevalonate kinase